MRDLAGRLIGGMREHTLQVSRSARYYTLGERGPRTRQVWIVCHGYGQLAANFAEQFAPLAGDGTRIIVAPEGLSRFYIRGAEAGPHRHQPVGASWMTRESRESEIDDYVRWLNAVHDDVFARIRRDSVRFAALGFSQGTATVCRWANRGGRAVDRGIAEVP